MGGTSKSSGSGKSTQSSITDRTFTGVGNLIKLLPTGTVFLFQFLNPVLTNNGHCHTINKYLTGILLGVCGFSCCFSSFTDSYFGSDGMTHYGVATKNGLWPSSASESVNLSAYKLRVGDFVHAFLSLTVFAVVALLDSNTVDCFYPSFESTEKLLLMVLPPVIGAISSTVFMVFPNKRHGIGYPASQTSHES
ncbi:Protein DMP2 [Vitis vinifera]|uniref:Protein DMP2 n=1 Tax=Vitis vinifera TaxID=29760 RepID=A0A438F6P0_VITVI|nr:Protein DMP2 [Vitis vinifera]